MAEVKLPDYNAMPHLTPAELIAKETEQRFSGWASVGATPSHSDYTALEREVAELKRRGRAVCALMGGLEGTPDREALDALAEACGRKG